MTEGRLACEVVCLFMDHSRDQWSVQTILHQPEYEDCADVGFISGILISTDPSHWMHGRRCRVPLNKVAGMVEFGTFEEFQAWVQHYAVP